ncbi:MAG: acyl-CoA thioesterase [Methylocystaceae bacterium]
MTEPLVNKAISESATILSQLILPGMTNPAGTAHGGELLKMMDNAAGVCATKHCRAIVVTAGIDNVSFHEPVFMGNLVSCHANLTYVGRSSMEVAVSIYAEDLMQGEKHCCMTAFFVFVALDQDLAPVLVPQLDLKNALEENLFEEGRERMRIRKEIPKLCWAPLY